MKNIVYVVVGISGSGKSTFVEKFKAKNPHVVIYSSDALRAVLGSGESDQSVSGQVFSVIRSNLNRDLANKKDVLIDATSLTRKDRRVYVDIAKEHDALAIAYVLERTRDELIRNQEKRKSDGGRRVPDDVIDKMIVKYTRPTVSEGFDKIFLV